MAEPAISTRQERLLTALLSETSIMAAAKKAGVSESTARRWLQETTFRAAYRVARRQVTETATVLLQRAASAAVATLLKNLKCGNPAVEVRAAGIILEMAFRGTENEDILARLDDLEAQSDPTGRHHHA